MHKENRIHETSQEPVQRHTESQREWRPECLLTWPLLWMKVALWILRGFFFFLILLGYNLFTKLCSFEVYSKMIQTHIYIYSLFRIFSHVGFFCVFVCAQLCLPLCGPLDYSPLGSSVPVISQPFPSPWDLPNPGIEPKSPALTGRFFRTEPSRNLI